LYINIEFLYYKRYDGFAFFLFDVIIAKHKKSPDFNPGILM